MIPTGGGGAAAAAPEKKEEKKASSDSLPQMTATPGFQGSDELVHGPLEVVEEEEEEEAVDFDLFG